MNRSHLSHLIPSFEQFLVTGNYREEIHYKRKDHFDRMDLYYMIFFLQEWACPLLGMCNTLRVAASKTTTGSFACLSFMGMSAWSGGEKDGMICLPCVIIDEGRQCKNGRRCSFSHTTKFRLRDVKL